jgi:hypothetical protein
MAENNLEKPSFFSIENTMEMGMGSAELLQDLMTPESASTNPDDVEPIVEKVKDDKPIVPEKKAKVKEITKEEGVEEPKPDLIADLLAEDDSEEGKEEKQVITSAKEEEQEEKEPSQFTALAKDLFKLGVFTAEDEEEESEINTPEEFRDRFVAEKKKGAMEVVQNFIGQFGEDYQNAFDAIYVKGVNPKDYFSVYNSVVEYAQLDMTKENNQEQVIRQALTDQQLEPEDITTEIERLKNYGDLETVAAKHHKVLVKKEAVKLQQMEQQAERDLQQKATVKNQYIKNVQDVLQEKIKIKEFDGIPINPKLAGELQDFLLVDKWKTPTGETLTDFDRAILELKRPENHVMKVKLGLLLKIMEKDPTLSTIQKSGVSKETNSLFTETARQKSKVQKTTQNTKPNSWFLQ